MTEFDSSEEDEIRRYSAEKASDGLESVSADNLNSNTEYQVIYFENGTTYTEGYGTLNDALTARDGISGPTALFIPPGSHTYSTTLTVGSNEAVITYGKDCTLLNYEGDIRAFHKEPGNDVNVMGGFKIDGTNAAAGTDGALIEGGIYCEYDAIQCVNFPGDGVIVYGEQGAGLYYTNFHYLRGQSCGGHGVRVYSPAGDNSRIQANNFEMVVALNNDGRGFSGENIQSGNQFDMVDCEGNADDQCYWSLDSGHVGVLYTGGSDGGTNSWGLNVADNGGGRLAIETNHIEGGSNSEVRDPGDRLNMTGSNHGLKYAEVNRDSSVKEQYLGRQRAGWDTVLRVHNGDWHWYENQNAQKVATMYQNGVLELTNSGEVRLGASGAKLYVDANGEIQAQDEAGNITQLT